MDTDLPYLVSPKRFPELLEKLQAAAVPERITFEFLKKLGFTSSNDRAFPSLLKRLGFLDQNGTPTERYRVFRQKPNAKRILAEAIREAYAELFSVHTNINAESRESIKGVVSRVTGREQRYVDLITSTFTMLCENADFTPEPTPKQELPKGQVPKEHRADPKKEMAKGDKDTIEKPPSQLSFHYNIEIHLPATTDISVYNAIFKSLKENLGD